MKYLLLGFYRDIFRSLWNIINVLVVITVPIILFNILDYDYTQKINELKKNVNNRTIKIEINNDNDIEKILNNNIDYIIPDLDNFIFSKFNLKYNNNFINNITINCDAFNEQNILKGRKIINDYEILISKSLIINNNISLNDDNLYLIFQNIPYRVKIVGIIDTPLNEIVTSGSFLNSVLWNSDYKPLNYALIINDYNNIYDVKKILRKNNITYCNNDSLQFEEITRLIKLKEYYMLFIFSVILILLIYLSLTLKSFFIIEHHKIVLLLKLGFSLCKIITLYSALYLSILFISLIVIIVGLVYFEYNLNNHCIVDITCYLSLNIFIIFSSILHKVKKIVNNFIKM